MYDVPGQVVVGEQASSEGERRWAMASHQLGEGLLVAPTSR